MQLFPAFEQTIAGLSQALHEGRTSSVEIVKSCLAAIEARESEIRAWVAVDGEGALARARALDKELARGRSRGPLHGIPIGIKDIIDVDGFPTRAGVTHWGENSTPIDSDLAARLRAAGAIILGKTVTTAFASFDPPPTRNPWNAAHTPGGSSSGSAAAVAAGMCPAAIGTQTGGSITRPASYCGIASCKPTFRQVRMDGIVPFAPSLDHAGPMARSVQDLLLVLEVISSSVAFPPEEEGRPLRLGRLWGLFDDAAEPAMRYALDAAAELFMAAGALVVDREVPDALADVHRQHRVIMCSEAAAFHEQRIGEFPDDYLPEIRGVIQEGLSISASEYVRCRQHQKRTHNEAHTWFAEVDAFLCPAAPGPAPDVSSTGDPIFNSPWSYTGLPTVSVPVGLSPDGLPLAIQLVGPPNDDMELLETACWCEAAIQSAWGPLGYAAGR